MIEDRALRHATMRYAATRICLWLLCGNRACLRARTCKGDVRRCTSLMVDWIEAMEEEKKLVRGGFAVLEDEIKTFEQLRVYLAWRDALDRAKAAEKHDPRETERLREEVARLVENMCKTVEWEREEALRKEREGAFKSQGNSDSARPPESGDPEATKQDREFDPRFPLTREMSAE